MSDIDVNSGGDAPTENEPNDTPLEETIPSGTEGMTVEEEFRFDPFEEGPAEPEASPTPVESAPAPAPAGVLPSDPQVAPSSISPEYAAMQARVEQLEAANTAAVAAAPAAPDEVLDGMLAKYNAFQLPTELMEYINSGDPAQQAQGLQAVMTGVAQAVTRQLYDHFNPQVSGFDTKVNEAITSYNQQKEIFNDFYGAYPGLNKPGLHQVVKTAMEQLLEDPAHRDKQYSAELRDMAATKAAELLGVSLEGLRGGGTVASPGSLPAQPKGTLLNGSARPAGTGSNLRDPIGDMMEAIGGERGARLPR